MKYLKLGWEAIMKNSVAIIIGALFIVYFLANNAKIQIRNEKTADDFQCQTLCFPQQHEYLYAGELGSCWCYEDRSTLKKLEK